MTSDLAIKLNFKSFYRMIKFEETDFYTEIYRTHQFKIQNQRIAVKRLKNICDATFELANNGGFSAMTLRQLSEKSGMSMGGLYAYISSKEDLAFLIYSSLNTYCQKQMKALVPANGSIVTQLETTLRCHLYLSELLQPWFYFAFMEARSLNNQKQMAIESELIMEDKLTKLIKKGLAVGDFYLVQSTEKAVRLNASLIKAMLQDWYLKKSKYQSRKITVEQYADEMITFTMSHLQCTEQRMSI